MEENTNVAANEEETAAPQIEQTTPAETTETEVTAEPTEKVETTEPVKQDITQTQIFAQRLKEETVKAAQKAKDDFIASQRYEWNGKPITSEAEYQNALMEKQYADKGLDPNLINEAISNNPMVKQAHEMMMKQQQQESKNAEYMDFLTAYPNIKPEEVTPEVWDLNNKGIPLKYAYAAAQETKDLKNKLSQYEKGQTTQTVNGKNAATSTGSVTGNGVSQTYYTREQVEGMSVNEVNKHYNEIMNSAKTWK